MTTPNPTARSFAAALSCCILTTTVITGQQPAAADGIAPLQPLACMVGKLEGRGSHQWGEYEETMTGTWILGGSVLEVRSESRIGDQTVFSDLRVFSYDDAAETIRLRQYAFGDLAIYDVTVDDDGRSLVFAETAHEGTARKEWRYELELDDDRQGFRYLVRERDATGELRDHVRGTLRRAVRDPGEMGELEVTTTRSKLALGGEHDGTGLDAALFVPTGDGAHPVLIFSPGGDARSTAGYDGFGKWFASWGFVTVLVAFDDDDAEERAAKFRAVADWVLAEATRDGSELHGRVDATKIAAAGHSRGGAAAILAAAGDARFCAAVGLAPSGPQKFPDPEHAPAILQVVGSADDYAASSKRLHDQLPAPSTLVILEGMDHMLRPQSSSHEAVRRITAFLNARLAGLDAYAAHVTKPASGVSVEHR